MKIFRTAACGLTGIFCAGFLQSCGGYHAGSDANSQPHDTLFFAAGANGGADGTYGRIDLTAP